MPIIFHADMDAFFVACELLDKPGLKGKPIVVGALPGTRGVVSTASYEARQFGVHSAMPISIAYRLCPQCTYLPVNGALYAEVSKKIFSLLAVHVAKLQQVSIDEAFFTTNAKSYEEAVVDGKRIKSLIKEKIGLTCSIGIGPNKSIAKIASDYKKPDGLTIVKPEEAQKFLEPLPVRKLHGVGPKTEMLLKSMRIITIGDIARTDVSLLASRLGKWGLYLHELSLGHGTDVLKEDHEVKSISRECTFENDVNDVKIIGHALDELAGELAVVAEKYNIMFRTITLKIRYGNFETHTKQASLHCSQHTKEAIAETAKTLCASFIDRKKVRLVGIRISGFSSEKQKNILQYGK